MYVSYNNSGGAYSSTQLIGTVSSTALGSTTTATIQQKASIGEGLYFRGLAFLGDKLYMGKGLVGNTTNTTELLYTVDWKGTWAIKKVANSGAKGLSDFASCSYGEPVAPSGPKFAVQKAIVNEDGTEVLGSAPSRLARTRGPVTRSPPFASTAAFAASRPHFLPPSHSL